MSVTLAEVGRLIVTFGADRTDLTKDLKAADKETRSTLDGLQDKANKGFTQLKKTVFAGAVAVVGAVGAIGTAALSVAQDYDDAQDKLIAATGASGAALENMSAITKSLHGTVAGLDRSMEDIAGVMGEVNTRTGATGLALRNFTDQVLKMTHITGDDGVTAVTSITRVMGDWGVPLEDSSLLMDKLFGAGQQWGIGLDSLAGKLVQFGAPMRLMGFSLDESINLLGKWEKEGVNTEVVMGSLRIAAGKYAKASAEVTETTTGGVKSMAEAQEKLDKLRQKMQVAALQQDEFTEKTKESARLAKRNQIEGYKAEIAELESAMALGEFQTVQSTAANRDLAESLAEDFEAIKNATTATEALNLGMELFGAKAGPDMVAAIREGRFEIGDATAVMNGMAGSIDDVSLRSMGLKEKWQIAMTDLKDSLLPVGQGLMALGEKVMPFVSRAAWELGAFISGALPEAMARVRKGWDEDWGGIRSTVEEAKTSVGLRLDAIEWKTGAFLDALQKSFGTTEDGVQFSWETFWGDMVTGASDTLIEITDGISAALTLATNLVNIWTGDTYTTWDGFWNNMSLSADSFGKFMGNFFTWSPPEWMQSLLKFYQSGGFGQNQAGGPIPLGYARGTAYAPGGLAMVGEQGPELVGLPRGSRVWDAADTRAMTGGENISIAVYQTFTGPADAPTVYRAAGAGALTVQQLRRRRGG